jgi:hypothetical protein
MALSFVQAASAQSTTNPAGQRLRTVFHPALCNNKELGFPITEAYPASSGTYTATDRPQSTNANLPALGNLCLPVQRNDRWCGEAQIQDNTTAAPGALALCTKNVSSSDIRQRIDIDRFATCPTGFGNAYVQSYRLTKVIPASQKCPGVFQPQTYVQFGGNIRTWWTLIYTAPGTTFTLELTVRCIRTTFPFDVELHVDRWRWVVVVTNESLDRVIDVLHSNSISTSEIPCIAAENMYIALKRSVAGLRTAIGAFRNATTDAERATTRNAAQDQVFNLEALIIAFCAFGDCFESSAANPGGVFFPVFPPSNDTQMSLSGMLTGVLDTPENPCCCKLLVDIEKLAEAYGIVSIVE